MATVFVAQIITISALAKEHSLDIIHFLFLFISFAKYFRRKVIFYISHLSLLLFSFSIVVIAPIDCQDWLNCFLKLEKIGENRKKDE